MRDVLITFLFALIIGAILNGSHGPAVSQSPNALQQEPTTAGSTAVSSVTQTSFDSEVLQSENPVLVEFWATWCGPCKRMQPIVEDVAKEFDGRLKTVKVDIDAEPELATKFNVNGVPTLMLFKNGHAVTVLSGVMAKESLTEQINKVL